MLQKVIQPPFGLDSRSWQQLCLQFHASLRTPRSLKRHGGLLHLGVVNRRPATGLKIISAGKEALTFVSKTNKTCLDNGNTPKSTLDYT